MSCKFLSNQRLVYKSSSKFACRNSSPRIWLFNIFNALQRLQVNSLVQQMVIGLALRVQHVRWAFDPGPWCCTGIKLYGWVCKQYYYMMSWYILSCMWVGWLGSGKGLHVIWKDRGTAGCLEPFWLKPSSLSPLLFFFPPSSPWSPLRGDGRGGLCWVYSLPPLRVFGMGFGRCPKMFFDRNHLKSVRVICDTQPLIWPIVIL
jgi:hypothetical protein